eukprot:7296821-Alexandrium_andersonii.AAC.1
MARNKARCALSTSEPRRRWNGPKQGPLLPDRLSPGLIGRRDFGPPREPSAPAATHRSGDDIV